MTKLKQKFQIEVWYRFMISGELEKDFEVHEIEANDLQDAVNIASEMYRCYKRIPFQYLYKGEKQKPTIITKEQIYNLTAPL